MSYLPSREMAERARVDGYAGLVVWKLIRAYVSGRLVDREAMTQVGWFNPDSKRFRYTDEKEHDLIHSGGRRFSSYTEPVFVAAAIGDDE